MKKPDLKNENVVCTLSFKLWSQIRVWPNNPTSRSAYLLFRYFDHVTWSSSADGLRSVVMEMSLLYASSAAVIISSTARRRI